jgi:hypothetical protein
MDGHHFNFHVSGDFHKRGQKEESTVYKLLPLFDTRGSTSRVAC